MGSHAHLAAFQFVQPNQKTHSLSLFVAIKEERERERERELFLNAY